MDSACALVANGQGITLGSRILSVSRAQLAQRMKKSGNKQNKCRRRCDKAADAEVLIEKAYDVFKNAADEKAMKVIIDF